MKIASFIANVWLAGPATTDVVYSEGKAAAKSHSQARKKPGVLQGIPEAKADNPNAVKDQSKHFHPRDMKYLA